jgi:hypothetical protein
MNCESTSAPLATDVLLRKVLADEYAVDHVGPDNEWHLLNLAKATKSLPRGETMALRAQQYPCDCPLPGFEVYLLAPTKSGFPQASAVPQGHNEAFSVEVETGVEWHNPFRIAQAKKNDLEA